MGQRWLADGRCGRLLRRLGAPALLSLGACVAIHRPPTTIAALGRSADSARVVTQAMRDTIIDRLARRAVARGDHTLDVLLLSGGGQMGAYGAGFLRGWRSRSDNPMPTFDLVTGVSTGSLQAPFALVGTEAALDTVVSMYRHAAKDFAPTFDWFFWLRRTGGLLKTDRFDRAVARAFDTQLRDELRAAFRDDRQLAIATTDLDLGVGRVWDIAGEMDSTAAGLARAHRLLRASSAISSVFPPVIVDGHVHTDGGSISNVLTILDLGACEALAARLTARGVTGPVTLRVWTILNVWTHAPLKVVDPAEITGVHWRADFVMLEATQPQIVERLSLLASTVNARVPELRVEMRFTAVPNETSVYPGAEKLFDTRFMNRLVDIGYSRARGATPWDSVATAYERPATPK